MDIQKRIYHTIIDSIFPHKDTIYIWSDTPKKDKFFSNMKNVTLVKTPQEADFLVIKHSLDIKSKGLKFASSYKILKYYKDDILGGFYWQKGRPNILFLEKNLEKHHIILPKSMHDYIESDL